MENSPFSKFRLKLAIPEQAFEGAGLQPVAVGLANAASTLVWDLAQPGSSPTSEAMASGSQKLYGNYLSDLESGRYNMSWGSWEEFLLFLAQEEASKSIELRKVSSTTGAERYLERTVYVCARSGTGGEKIYQKKHPDWLRKVPAKGTDCCCSLKVKKYHDVPTVLGKYSADHNHAIGVDNLRFTRISDGTREWIAGMVRTKVKTEHILEMIHNLCVHDLSSETTFTPDLNRNHFITLADVRRIEKAIEAETVRLSPDDGKSVFLWAERLRALDSLLGFKSCACSVPRDSKLADNAFVLMVQTPTQREQFHCYGNKSIVYIDGTHNTTMYQNMTLTTILVRDHWGHGLPVAWMLASSGTEETISYFLYLVRAANLFTIPWRFMTDRDFAQINAIGLRYPESDIWLCWWHVLHAWQQHFNISQNELLWTKLKALIRLEDSDLFNAALVEIERLAPPRFWAYLVKNWLSEKLVRMWSAVHRRSRGIHLLNDTNMLIEAWHHVLKGKFLEGRRNRRLDHLLHVLIDKILPYYLLKERRQKYGFEGENLENQKRRKITASAKTVKFEDIKQSSLDLSMEPVYLVKSASRPDHWYEVDILAYTCTCPDYPVISFCKHIHAVQIHFPAEALATSPGQVDAHFESSATICPEEEPSTMSGMPLRVGLGLITSHDAETEVLAHGLDSKLSLEDHNAVAEKLERFAAQFRRFGSAEQALRISSWLDMEIALEDSATRSLLPEKQKLSPRLNSWPETQAAMMPPKKTRTKKAGDEAYGAGEASGKKAKTLSKSISVERPPVAQSAPVSGATNSSQASVLSTGSIQVPLSQAATPSQPTSSYYRSRTHLY